MGGTGGTRISRFVRRVPARLRGGTPRRRAGVALSALALVVVLVAAGVTVWSGSPGSGGKPDIGGKIAAVRIPDRVPDGPVVRDVPSDCGVAPATVDRLMPGAEKRRTSGLWHNSCTWRIRDTAGRGHGDRRLTVDLDVGAYRTERTSGSAGTIERFTEILSAELKPSGTRKSGTVRRVAGLGREAFVWRFVDLRVPAGSPNGQRRPRSAGSTVVFRAGNVSGTVTYAGSDHPDTRGSRPGLVAEAATRRGALRTATQVARALKLPVSGTPAVTSVEPSAEPVHDVPDPCTLVHTATFASLDAPPVEPTHAGDNDKKTDGKGIGTASCYLNTSHANFGVDVTVFRDSRTGSGESRAARMFLQHYHRAREERVDNVEYVFGALRAPGDQAYMFYADDTTDERAEGIVRFRVRNVLVEVGYRPESRSPGPLLNGAYAMARDAARTVTP